MTLVPIRLRELESEEVEIDHLRKLTGLDPADLADRLKPLVELAPSWAGRCCLRAGQTVGTLQVGALRVDVLPRLAADEMATLIRYALGGQFTAHHRSSIETGEAGLEELVASLFADELFVIRQVGISRQYVNRRETLPALRGRPDFLGSFPWNDGGMATLSCRYHELSSDNLDNQLMRAALERSTFMEISVPTRQRLLEHRQAWSAIASARHVTPADFGLARRRYTRLSEHYRLAHILAEMILHRERPQDLYEQAFRPTAGLHVEMPGLF